MKIVILAILLSAINSVHSAPYLQYGTNNLSGFTGFKKDDDIAISLDIKNDEFKQSLYTALNDYLQNKQISVSHNSSLQLSIVCERDNINEPYTFTEVIPVASSTPSAPIYHTKTIDGMRTVDALKCIGNLRRKQLLWEFIVRIPQKFIPNLTEKEVSYISTLFEYEGTGYINLETGEVY